MSTTESHVGGLLGLAVAWETLAAALGALLVGLAVWTVFRVRAVRRQQAAMAEGERESTLALAEALDRERLILSIGRRLRAELGLDDALQAGGGAAGAVVRGGRRARPQPLLRAHRREWRPADRRRVARKRGGRRGRGRRRSS